MIENRTLEKLCDWNRQDAGITRRPPTAHLHKIGLNRAKLLQLRVDRHQNASIPMLLFHHRLFFDINRQVWLLQINSGFLVSRVPFVAESPPGAFSAGLAVNVDWPKSRVETPAGVRRQVAKPRKVMDVAQNTRVDGLSEQN